MKIEKFIENLLIELSYRSNEGYPQLTNPTHQRIIDDILYEWDLGELSKPLIKNLLEAEDDDEPQSDYEHLGAGVYVRRGDKGKEGARKYKKTDTGSFQSITDDEYEKIKAKQGDSGEEAASDTPQNQTDTNNGEDEEENTASSLDPNTSSGKSYIDSLPKDDPARKSASDNKESDTEQSVNKSGKIYGTDGEGDTDVKNDMFKYGFSGYKKGTGKNPAPGSAGSAFNEIVSGEGVHMLRERPDMSEEELARKMYNEYKDTALADEQSKSSGVGKIPKDIENPKLYSKCVISARSAKTKYETTQNRIDSLQKEGSFGSLDNIKTYYGAEESIDAQILAITDANKVVLPNGTEVNKEDAVKFVKAGGGGMNPSDTATFAEDKNGNLLIQFHSDKTSTSDIQDNSTLAQEGENYKETIDTLDNLSDEAKEQAKEVVNTYSDRISKIEENYNNQTTKIASRLIELPMDEQLEIIENDKGTLQKNIEVAIFGSDGTPKSQFKNYLPSDSTTDSLTLKQKYDAIRQIVTNGGGKSNEIKVITKVGLKLQSEKPSIEGIDVKKLISEERAQVVNLQRERIDELNKQSVDVDGVDVPLGRLMEAEETIRGFHLGLMNYPPKDYNEGNPSTMIGSTLDINMGGNQVNGEVLRSCIGVTNTTEFKQKFRLRESDELQKDSQDNVTGKVVFVYAIDKDGSEIEVGKKTYRSKAGATGKTSNTFTYSTQMQKCFSS